MTTGMDHETIGALIARHKASLDRIRRLRGPYRALARQLRDLSMMANDHESTFRITPEGFISGYNSTPIPMDLLQNLAVTLRGLQDAREEKRNIETCLKEKGFGDYIPPEENTN